MFRGTAVCFASEQMGTFLAEREKQVRAIEDILYHSKKRGGCPLFSILPLLSCDINSGMVGARSTLATDYGSCRSP